MFDLFRSRAKAVRYLLGALLLLVALSMVVTLIPGFGGGGGRSEQVVAEIAGEPLTAREVQLNIQAALRSKSIPPDMVQFYARQYVTQMIAERALAYQAARMGFKVSESELVLTIQSMLPQLFQGGKFVGRQQYEAYLAQNNMSIPEFESNLRKQMLLNRLRNIVLEGVLVTPELVETEYRRRKEKIKVDYVKFGVENFKKQVSVTPKELQDLFNQQRSTFRVPEKRSFQVLVVDQAKVSESIQVPEGQLRQAYEAGKDRYRTPERVRARHILLKTTGKSKEEAAGLVTKADNLLKQIKGGADFAALAKKNSEDTGSAEKGGDLGWIVRGQTVKNFEDTVFSLKPKEISGLVNTEYGIHIIQALEKEDARLKSFEDAKAELMAEMRKQLVFDRMQTLSDQAHEQLVASPQKAAEIAQKLGIGLVTVDKVSPGDPIPEVGVQPEFNEAVNSLQPWQVTPVLQVPGDKLVMAVLTELLPPRNAEFQEVEAQVRDRVVSEKARKLAEQKAKEAAARMAEGGADFKKLASSTGGEFGTTSEFARDGAADGIGGASYLVDAFTREVGATLGPIQVTDSWFLVKVAAKVPADMNAFLKERDEIVTSLKRKKANERNDLFEDGVVAQLVKEGKVKIHQDAISRLVTSYRS